MKHLPLRHQNRPDDDPIFALNREARQRAAAGETVLNATVGALLEDDGELAVMPSVTETLREIAPARSAAYAPIAGYPEFLDAVLDDLLGGTALRELAVAVATPGGTGALRHAVSVFLEHGQSAVTGSFYWGPYNTICDEHERGLVTFSLFDTRGRFHAEAFAATLERCGREQSRLLVLLNDPCHNPTGYSLDTGEWGLLREALLASARRVPTTLLVDVAYLAYARDSKAFLRELVGVVGEVPVLFAWSSSKAYTQYGLRVGALVACVADPAERQAVRNALTYACRGTWSNCHAGGQLAITRCLREPPLRARVEAERARLVTLLAERVEVFNHHAVGKLPYPRYDGGFFVTVFAPDAAAAATKLKARGIFTVPQKGALRVALCSVPKARVPELVDGLQACLSGA